jgi:hypothetical protein
MCTNFFRDYTSNLTGLNMKKKMWTFIDRVQSTHLTMVPKVTPMGLLSYVQNKKNFPKNQSGSRCQQ